MNMGCSLENLKQTQNAEVRVLTVTNRTDHFSSLLVFLHCSQNLPHIQIPNEARLYHKDLTILSQKEHFAFTLQAFLWFP